MSERYTMYPVITHADTGAKHISFMPPLPDELSAVVQTAINGCSFRTHEDMTDVYISKPDMTPHESLRKRAAAAIIEHSDSMVVLEEPLPHGVSMEQLRQLHAFAKAHHAAEHSHNGHKQSWYIALLDRN